MYIGRLALVTTRWQGWVGARLFHGGTYQFGAPRFRTGPILAIGSAPVEGGWLDRGRYLTGSHREPAPIHL